MITPGEIREAIAEAIADLEDDAELLLPAEAAVLLRITRQAVLAKIDQRQLRSIELSIGPKRTRLLLADDVRALALDRATRRASR